MPAELLAAGTRCGHKRGARLLRRAGLVGCHRRRPVHPTQRDPKAAPAPELVQPTLSTSAPDQLWIATSTDVPTWEGVLSLAVLLAVCSRRVVGWSLAAHLRRELVVAALEMAVWNRRPGAGVIPPSDPGGQYTALRFGERSQAVGIRCSLGSVGSVGDSSENRLKINLQSSEKDAPHCTRRPSSRSVEDAVA